MERGGAGEGEGRQQRRMARVPSSLLVFAALLLSRGGHCSSARSLARQLAQQPRTEELWGAAARIGGADVQCTNIPVPNRIPLLWYPVTGILRRPCSGGRRLFVIMRAHNEILLTAPGCQA